MASPMSSQDLSPALIGSCGCSAQQLGNLDDDCFEMEQGGKSCAWDPRRKVWTRTKILSPNIRYFVAILRFVAIYLLFGDLWPKKCLFE